MRRMFQTRFGKGTGNCAQAAMASLFGIDIYEVPDFITRHTEEEPQSIHIMRFMESRGYEYTTYIWTHRFPSLDQFKNILRYDGGIDGFFYAIIDSLTLEDSQHAVIINTDMQVVHDPNPNGRALGLAPEMIKAVLTVSNFYIDNGVPYGKS